MKIAHIVCSFPPYYGGMGNAALQMVSELTQLGHDVEVITPLYGREDVPAEQADYAQRLRPSISYGNAARLPKLSKELKRFDLIHLHYPFFGTANIVRRFKQHHPEVPLVITYHMDTRGPGWKGLFFKYYCKYWMPKVLGSADALIASSFDYITSSQAASLYQEQPDKWHELPFGVDTDRFAVRDKPEALFERYALAIDAPTIVFVGGMDPAHYFKGVPVLLKALVKLKHAGVPVQGVLVGGGSLQAQFELQARGLGLRELVRFVGHVSDEELPYHYNMADLTILPSLHQAEAFGMVLLESFASGVPVVASDLPGVRSVASQAGFVCPPHDATALAEQIADYFSPETDWQDWQMRARDVAVSKYGWKPIVARLAKLYEKLVMNG